MSNRYALIILAMMASPLRADVPKIKVRIGKHLKTIYVSGIDLTQSIIGQSRPKIYKGSTDLRYNCDNAQGALKNKKPILVSQVSSQTGLVSWEKHKYRGQLLVVAAPYDRGCDLINEMTLDTYISTLLGKEMSSKWPIEALKAQAVAARSYAYHKIITKQVSKTVGHETYYDLENSEKHQVNGSFMESTSKTAKAAGETRGEVLLLKSGKVTPIFFHSKCGGHTLRPEQVWGSSVEGYRSVPCPYCHKHGMKKWSRVIQKDHFKNYLEQLFGKSQFKGQVTVVPNDKEQTYLRLYNDDQLKMLKKADLRNLMGRKLAPSNYFTINQENNKILLEGQGYGHGVGMCQFGAYELAQRGYTYKQILAHYFPEHVIEKIY